MNIFQNASTLNLAGKTDYHVEPYERVILVKRPAAEKFPPQFVPSPRAHMSK